MTRILALDMGTHYGWAHTNGSFGAGHLPGPEHGNGHRFWYFEDWLANLAPAADAVYYELPHHRGGPATRLSVGLMAIVEKFCFEHGLACKGVHTATLKKWATGSGRADKAMMIAAANKRNPERDWAKDGHDVVDALFLLDLALGDLK